MTSRIPALLLTSALLVACSYKGPSLAGYEGLGLQVERYYERRAWEENARCILPDMIITRAKVIEDTPERLVLDVRYSYDDSDDAPGDGDLGIVTAGDCRGFNTRRFTIAKSTDGRLDVMSMSGPQRDIS